MSAIEVSSWPRQKWHWSIISGTAYIYSNLLIYSNIANDLLNRSRNLTMIELKALKTWFWCINIQSWIMWYNFTLHNRWSGIVALHCSRKVGFVKQVSSYNAMQETETSKDATKKGKGQRETVFQMQYNYELCNRCTRRKSSFVITQKSAKSLGFQFIVSEAEFLNEADIEICAAVVATLSGYHLCRCLSRKSHMKSKKSTKMMSVIWRRKKYYNLTPTLLKHCKNCECCPVSLQIVTKQRLSWIQDIDCQNFKQCKSPMKLVGGFMTINVISFL